MTDSVSTLWTEEFVFRALTCEDEDIHKQALKASKTLEDKSSLNNRLLTCVTDGNTPPWEALKLMV